MSEPEFLAWDSQHFGYKIGRVLLDQQSFDRDTILEAARKQAYDLIYLFSKQELDGMQAADIKIVCEKEAQQHQGDWSAIHSYSQNTVSSDLLHLAYESGKYSRFLLEPRFLDSQFQSLYQIWIEKSLSGELADDVIVYEHEGRIMGFIAYRWRDNSYADICLIAVDPHATKMGIASRLVHYLEHLALKRQIKYIRTTTQQHNEVACAFYQKLQFKTIESTYIYHLWL